MATKTGCLKSENTWFKLQNDGKTDCRKKFWKFSSSFPSLSFRIFRKLQIFSGFLQILLGFSVKKCWSFTAFSTFPYIFISILTLISTTSRFLPSSIHFKAASNLKLLQEKKIDTKQGFQSSSTICKSSWAHTLKLAAKENSSIRRRTAITICRFLLLFFPLKKLSSSSTNLHYVQEPACMCVVQKKIYIQRCEYIMPVDGGWVRGGEHMER